MVQAHVLLPETRVYQITTHATLRAHHTPDPSTLMLEAVGGLGSMFVRTQASLLIGDLHPVKPVKPHHLGVLSLHSL
jgi:hypothetical protein